MLVILKSMNHALVSMRHPSRAQLEAGNYRKHKLRFQGLDISIENPRGTIRRGYDPDGKEWASGMAHHYGYIRRTLGVDRDHFDCFVGPNAEATHAFVITTMKPPTFAEPDEQKVMLGFNSEHEAREAYLQHYDDPRFCGPIVTMTMPEFKAKVATTREDPRMLKGMVLFFKAELGRHDKLSNTMREKIGTVGSKHREDMPADAFLLGRERKYPVKIKRDGKWCYSVKLLEAAAERARLMGREDIATRADKIRAGLK